MAHTRYSGSLKTKVLKQHSLNTNILIFMNHFQCSLNYLQIYDANKGHEEARYRHRLYTTLRTTCCSTCTVIRNLHPLLLRKRLIENIRFLSSVSNAKSFHNLQHDTFWNFHQSIHATQAQIKDGGDRTILFKH